MPSPADDAEAPSYLTCDRGLRSWLFTRDHKRIGVLYLVALSVVLLLGVGSGLLLRFGLLRPAGSLEASSYDQVFTLHGAALAFLLIPAIPASLGSFVVPLMLGAPGVAFPRVHLAGFYLWVLGALALGVVMVLGGFDTGWTFTTPYSTSAELGSKGAIALAAGGIALARASAACTAINLLATIHQMRPAGMKWFRMPLFLWAMYAASLVQLVATPVLLVTMLLLALERMVGLGVFDPALGGDPLLFQHFFWFSAQPSLYVMLLPAIGVVSELVGTFSRKPIFGYGFVAMSSLALAVLGFLVWGQHMFTSGQSLPVSMIFSALAFLVAIPSAIVVGSWLTTLHGGAILMVTPLLYALGFIVLFTVGALTGLCLSTLSVAMNLEGTYFAVAQFHFMAAAALMAVLGGLHYWWPKMFGVVREERTSRRAAVLLLIGFIVMLAPQLVMGARGMPRRQASYPADLASLQYVSAIGAALVGGGLLLALLGLLWSLRSSSRAAANPWGANTLEWYCASPPPRHNFLGQPSPSTASDFRGWRYDTATRGYVRQTGQGAA